LSAKRLVARYTVPGQRQLPGWRSSVAGESIMPQTPVAISSEPRKPLQRRQRASLLGGTMASVAVANAKSFPTPDARMPVGRGRLGVAPSMAK